MTTNGTENCFAHSLKSLPHICKAFAYYIYFLILQYSVLSDYEYQSALTINDSLINKHAILYIWLKKVGNPKDGLKTVKNNNADTNVAQMN